MEDKNEEIIEKDLSKFPFTLYFGNTELPMKDIKEKSNNYIKDLENYKIGYYIYSLKFLKKDEYECEMSIYLKNSFEFSINLLFAPSTLCLNELNLSPKNISLYSIIQIKRMIYYYKYKYIFTDQNNNKLDEGMDFKSLKNITIKKKDEFDLNNIIYLNTRKKAEAFFTGIESNIQKEILDIDPLLLSFNFFKIFSEHSEKESFKLILNEDRKNFLENVENFLSSHKKFLWIVGSDGIGKTISLMYFSLIHNDNVFYINLKFLQKNSDKIKEFLTNDLIKPYYLSKYNKDEKPFKNIQKNLDYILREIFTITENDNKLESIYKFWIYLRKAFEISDKQFCNKSLTIILDQYRDISSDYNYNYLNDFIKYVDKKSYKLIISTSINNSDIQSNFYNNIDYFNFNGQAEIDSDESDPENLDIESEDYGVEQECKFYQNILDKKIQKDIIEKENNETIPVYSQFILNTEYKDDTSKVYYSSLVLGKAITKQFKEEEKNCFKNFNYNLKYINKYIKFKADYIKEKNKNKNKKNNINNNNQNNNEIKDPNKTFEKKYEEEDIPEIIEKFYKERHHHMKQKISGFYSIIENENQSVTVEEYIRLKELRDIIFNKDLFTIGEIRKKMKFYPGKYLYIIPKKSINIESPNQKEIQTFQIKYPNMFCKLTINNLLNILEDEIQALNRFVTGSGGGINFERNVIDSILYSSEQVFGQLFYKKRIVFSLVGKTKNSKKTIEKHRAEEKNNKLFKFYGVSEYTEKIDDIDYDNNSTQIKLADNLYLITQASKTGRSFDFAILKKSNDSDEWFLYLFQATINKVNELKSKEKYISDSFKCELYLNGLYHITIKKIFLIFVIPYNAFDNAFTFKLDERKIFYIYYKSCQFYDRYNNIISNLNFIGAEITKKERKDIDYDQLKIEKSLNAWEISVNKYLKRKRERDLSEYYSKNLAKIEGRGIKLNLPEEIKEKIFKAIYKSNSENENDLDLLFVGNCKINKIKDIFKKNSLLIFFKVKGGFYFYYVNYYHLVNDSFDQISKIPQPEIERKLKYDKNIINLDEINDKIDLCFCYKILREID